MNNTKLCEYPRGNLAEISRYFFPSREIIVVQMLKFKIRRSNLCIIFDSKHDQLINSAIAKAYKCKSCFKILDKFDAKIINYNLLNVQNKFI